MLISSSRVWGTMASRRFADSLMLPKVGWLLEILRCSPPQVARAPPVILGMFRLPLAMGTFWAPSSKMTVLEYRSSMIWSM